jgi:Zn-finger nucleic acid-binding protein
MEHELIQLELKYCERCGGLWLRRQGVSTVYCPPCSAEVPEFGLRRRARTRERTPIGRKTDRRRQFEVITSIFAEGGQK